MARMTQAALGIGCLAGSGPALHAAQWSFAPQASISIDSDSNRYLNTDPHNSQSAFVNPSAVFQWSSENSQLSLTPWLIWQQISDSSYPNAHSESISGEYDWTSERAQLTLQGGISDYTTLTTDIPDTGLVAPGLNRRTRQGSLAYSRVETERRSLVLQMSWLDVGYYGPNTELFNLTSAYKYASVMVGEKFILSPQTAVTPALFDNQVITPLSLENSRESGLRINLNHDFTERISFTAYIGASQQALENVVIKFGLRSIQPTNRVAGLGGFHLSLATLQGHLDLDYANSLQPYSGGLEAQRQAVTLSATQSLSEKIDATVSAVRIQNNASAVELGIDRAYYDTATLGVDWHFAETWRLHADVGASHTDVRSNNIEEPTQPVTEWRVGLALKWTPLPTVRTF
jgi:hypothetical protein